MDFLAKIRKLRPVFFKWRKNEFPQFNFEDGAQVGLIAQELEKVFPELVCEGKEGFKEIKYGWLPFYLLQAIIEQQKEIEKLKKEVRILKRKTNRESNN